MWSEILQRWQQCDWDTVNKSTEKSAAEMFLIFKSYRSYVESFSAALNHILSKPAASQTGSAAVSVPVSWWVKCTTCCGCSLSCVLSPPVVVSVFIYPCLKISSAETTAQSEAVKLQKKSQELCFDVFMFDKLAFFALFALLTNTYLNVSL